MTVLVFLPQEESYDIKFIIESVICSLPYCFKLQIFPLGGSFIAWK